MYTIYKKKLNTLYYKGDYPYDIFALRFLQNKSFQNKI